MSDVKLASVVGSGVKKQLGSFPKGKVKKTGKKEDTPKGGGLPHSSEDSVKGWSPDPGRKVDKKKKSTSTVGTHGETYYDDSPINVSSTRIMGELPGARKALKAPRKAIERPIASPGQLSSSYVDVQEGSPTFGQTYHDISSLPRQFKNNGKK